MDFPFFQKLNWNSVMLFPLFKSFRQGPTGMCKPLKTGLKLILLHRLQQKRNDPPGGNNGSSMMLGAPPLAS